MKQYKPYVEKLAIFGCYAIAVVYFMVGLVALLSFLGQTSNGADEESIMGMILEIPLGEVLVGIVILGMLGYIVWRVFEAFADPYNFGGDLMGISRRTGIALSAVGYLIIAFAAGQALLEGGGNGDEDQQQMIAQVLEWPAGQWLVAIAGAITGFAGLVQFKYVIGGDYIKRIDFHNMPPWLDKTTHILGWAGYFARGIILLVIAYFLLHAGIAEEPQAMGDTDEAFDFMGDFGVIGHIVFIAVALGTMGYGVFMVIHGYFYSFKSEK